MKNRRTDGDLFVERCSERLCDGSHCIIKIGQEGKPAIARHVTDAAGAREFAAMLCQIAAELEAHGHGAKPQ